MYKFFYLLSLLVCFYGVCDNSQYTLKLNEYSEPELAICDRENIDERALQEERRRVEDKYHFVSNGNNLFNFFYDKLLSYSYNSDYLLRYGSQYINPGFHKYFKKKLDHNICDVTKFGEENELDFYLYDVWRGMDRSSSHIEHILRNTDEEQIFSLLNKKPIYSKSGAKLLIKALLISYKELEGKDQLLEQLYIRASKINVVTDTEYRQMASEAVINILSKDNPFDKGSLYMEQTRYSWVYSFWVRRHHEGNAKIVFKLLAKIDSKLGESNLQSRRHDKANRT